ncbi:hypothetical protein SRB17_81740 [Streptomyces sp. RB17]|nr:hypothetical protein [Streptomyces sp. RB17]
MLVQAAADHRNEGLVKARREIDAVFPALVRVSDNAILRRQRFQHLQPTRGMTPAAGELRAQAEQDAKDARAAADRTDTAATEAEQAAKDADVGWYRHITL